MSNSLLIIDPQNDFVDPMGSLYVPGADLDMNRLCAFIENNQIDEITVTLDSHSEFDIAHPAFWEDPQKKSPNPFKVISVDEVLNGNWRPVEKAFQRWCTEYVQELERRGKYQLTIWPPHCITGSWGQCIWPKLSDVLRTWEKDQKRSVNYIYKGQNALTEHYSAVKAEVPDPNDKNTSLNKELISLFEKDNIDKIYIAGEALSHCVAGTVRDLAANLSEKTVGKMVLLADCTNSVPGFESAGQEFIEEMTSQGMKTLASN